MHSTAHAVLFHGTGQALEHVEVPLPQLETGEVLIKVSCSTLCGSDVHTYCGHRSTPCPTILGHEILGNVAGLPQGEPVADHAGNPLQIGDRVTWGIAASCGTCFSCRNGLPQKCESLFKYGHERFTEQHPLSGGLAESCHLAAGTPIFRVPAALSDAVACPANCATATIAAALRYAGDCRDRSILIQGAGMLGLTAAAMARYRGAAEVIVTDVVAERLQRALDFGATRVAPACAEPDQLQETVSAATAGRGVDIAIDVSGAPAAMQQGVERLRTGGRAIWVGAVFPTPPVSLIPEQIVRKLITIQGVHNYIPEDLAAALKFLEACHDKYPFEQLVGTPYALAEAEVAFATAQSGSAFRVMLQP